MVEGVRGDGRVREAGGPAAEADTTAELSLDLRRTTHFAFHSTLLSQRSSLSLLRPST